MTEMGVAYSADDLGAHHAVGAVDFFNHVIGIERREVTGPTATRVELGIG